MLNTSLTDKISDNVVTEEQHIEIESIIEYESYVS